MFKCRQEEGNYIVKVLLEPSTGNAYAGARDQHIGVIGVGPANTCYGHGRTPRLNM